MIRLLFRILDLHCRIGGHELCYCRRRAGQDYVSCRRCGKEWRLQ